MKMPQVHVRGWSWLQRFKSSSSAIILLVMYKQKAVFFRKTNQRYQKEWPPSTDSLIHDMWPLGQLQGSLNVDTGSCNNGWQEGSPVSLTYT